jgi:hypothetical protein
MLSAIRDLREVAELCSQGQPLGDRLGNWLAQSLDAFLSQRAQSLDEALGLRSPRGGVPWWREEAIRIRDSLLREFAQAHFPHAQVSERARHLRVLSLRYAASSWRFDRESEDFPSHRAGSVSEWLCRIFRSGAPMPISERHLRTILGGVTPRETAARRSAVRRVGENNHRPAGS